MQHCALTVTDIPSLNSMIQDVFATSEEAEQDGPTETFTGDIVSTLNDIADKVIRKVGKAIPPMGREDKIEIVRQLDKQGFFLIKGAIKLIAGKLKVSKFTIYDYLEQIRSETKVATY